MYAEKIWDRCLPSELLLYLFFYFIHNTSHARALKYAYSLRNIKYGVSDDKVY